MTHITGDMVGTVSSETLAVLLTLGDTTLAQPLVQEHGYKLTKPSQLKEGIKAGNRSTFLHFSGI